jgi:hypothetical protein
MYVGHEAALGLWGHTDRNNMICCLGSTDTARSVKFEITLYIACRPTIGMAVATDHFDLKQSFARKECRSLNKTTKRRDT